MYQIPCSTIVKMLDHIFNSASSAITSEIGMKKRKLAEHKISNRPRNEENALSSLSSLLDILLLKKDIENRFGSFNIKYISFLLQCIDNF